MVVVSEVGAGYGAPRFSGGLSDAAKERLGSRVREVATGMRVSQTTLVARTGLGKGTVEELWWGRSNPRLSTLLAVVHELHLRSIEELLGPLGTQLMIDDMRQQPGGTGS